ncbi:hypothetical protein D3C81_1630390 [compost metagenome]
MVKHGLDDGAFLLSQARVVLAHDILVNPDIHRPYIFIEKGDILLNIGPICLLSQHLLVIVKNIMGHAIVYAEAAGIGAEPQYFQLYICLLRPADHLVQIAPIIHVVS